jgi:hypothetical protein
MKAAVERKLIRCFDNIGPGKAEIRSLLFVGAHELIKMIP